MISQRRQPLLNPRLGMEICHHNKDNKEEEDAADDGPFDYVGVLQIQPLVTGPFAYFLVCKGISLLEGQIGRRTLLYQNSPS
jgi:hypothetical protein